MVVGLDKFIEHFKGMEDAYILIGGTACDLWMGSYGLPFRITKDLDVVLVIEALTDEFIDRFWEFINIANYASRFESNGHPCFYRFKDPQTEGFPVMIELFSRKPFKLTKESHLAPFPVGEDQISLSVILLDDEYYNFIIESRESIDDVPTIPVHCLIPLKAKAYMDLSSRKTDGDKSVQSKDIKKHRNDVFRLYRTIAPEDRFTLPDVVRDDLRAFLDGFPPNASVWKDIRQAVDDPDLPPAEEIITQLYKIFNIAIQS